MDVWERSRVLALAPDDAARKAAIPLLSEGRWSGSGSAEGPLLWGRCHGSADYAVAARPGSAYACSCPSRKSPCKHALALMLRWAGGSLGSGEPPAYALALGGPKAAVTRKPSGPPDNEAAAQRAATRVARVTSGLDELDTWLGDQVGTGLADLERDAYAQLEAVAARMVDAQAPGVAGMLRAIPALLALEDWPSRVLDAFAALHLLIAAHRGLDRLPADLAATVRSRVGYPITKASVVTGPPVVDHWWAMASLDSLEGRLEARRVWLWGLRTRRWALLLSFAVPDVGPGLDETVMPGQTVNAALHFYPGAGELRAVLGEQWPPDDEQVGVDAETVPEARSRWAALVAADPWASRMPVALRAVPVPPGPGDRTWYLRHNDATAVPLVDLFVEPWPLLALAAGDPVTVVGEWGRAGLRPLRVLVESTDADPRLVAVA